MPYATVYYPESALNVSQVCLILFPYKQGYISHVLWLLVRNKLRIISRYVFPFIAEQVANVKGLGLETLLPQVFKNSVNIFWKGV